MVVINLILRFLFNESKDIFLVNKMKNAIIRCMFFKVEYAFVLNSK